MIVWYGSELSYNNVLAARVKLDGLLKSSPNIGDRFEMPSLYTLQGDVGVVSMKGDLINGDAGWLQIFGITGYDNVAAALIEAVQDKNAKSIMMDINSPGGSAKGTRQLGDFVKNVGKVKPVSAYADTIGSAAYWVGSAAGNITLDEMGAAGSIGALIIHTDLSMSDQQEGIKRTVIRGGVNKALANPYEPLSEAARAELQEVVDSSRDLFTAAVADHRGTTVANVNANMGQGKMFMGVKALAAGLVDKVGTFEDAMEYSIASRDRFKPAKAVKV